MSLGIIIPIRSTSKRLPQKHTCMIGNRTLIELLVLRMRDVTPEAEIVLAMPVEDYRSGYPGAYNVPRFGSDWVHTTDVMGRVAQCVHVRGFSEFVLVWGDSPLMCPRLVDRLVALGRAEDRDLISNRGLSGFRARYVKTEWFLRWQNFIMSEPEQVLQEVPLPSARYLLEDATWDKFSVDTLQDLEFVRSIHREVGDFGTLQQCIEAARDLRRGTHDGPGDPTGHTPLDSAPDADPER